MKIGVSPEGVKEMIEHSQDDQLILIGSAAIEFEEDNHLVSV